VGDFIHNLNSTQVAAIGVGVAIIGVGVAWFIYRHNAWRQRQGVLSALRRELELHESWVGTEYIRGVTPRGWWETEYDRIAFKLSTVAIDAAIATGPSLFLNRQLVTALVGYRQRVLGFNQLVDRAAAFQASPELYRRFPRSRLVARMKQLLDAIHFRGVGHGDESLADEGQGKANYYFKQVSREVEREERLRVRSVIWYVTGFRLSP
jgi:hypothetical protein